MTVAGGGGGTQAPLDLCCLDCDVSWQNKQRKWRLGKLRWPPVLSLITWALQSRETSLQLGSDRGQQQNREAGEGFEASEALFHLAGRDGPMSRGMQVASRSSKRLLADFQWANPVLQPPATHGSLEVALERNKALDTPCFLVVDLWAEEPAELQYTWTSNSGTLWGMKGHGFKLLNLCNIFQASGGKSCNNCESIGHTQSVKDKICLTEQFQWRV